MEQEIKGLVASATPVKSGTSQGKDGSPLNWTLYKVFINNQEFSTFDKTYAEKVGQEITARFVIKQNGQYTNYTLLPLNAKPNLSAILERIERKVDTLLARNEQPTDTAPLPEPQGEELPTPDDIDIEFS